MALAIVQQKGVYLGASPPLTFAFDATPTNGNLLLYFVGNTSSSSLIDSGAQPSDSLIKLAAQDGASFQGGGGVYYKRASSEDNSYSFPDDGGFWNGSVHGVELSGDDLTDATTVEAVVAFGPNTVIKSITTVTNNAYVFGATIVFDHDPFALSIASGGWTKIDQNLAGDIGIAVWYKELTTAGASGDSTVSGTDGFPSVSWTVAIKPLSGGGGAQDTPELRLRRNQMRQLIAQ